MKRQTMKILLVILLCMMGGETIAETFWVDYTDGKSIRYQFIKNDTEVMVLNNANYKNYSGGLVIPGYVSRYGKVYPVTSIGDSAFKGCTGLTSVTIGNSVTSIGNYAFQGCTGLTSLTVGSSVASIGEYVFEGCSGLTSVSIPNSVTSIGDYAFYGCSGLTSLTVGSSVSSIGEYVFEGCSGLTSIIVSIDNSNYDSRNNCNAIIEKASNTLIRGCNTTNIPNSVTSIGDRAFYNCSGLTSVSIPNSVTSIGWGAFSGCSGLTAVAFNATNCTSMDGVFANCSAFTKLSIGDNVKNIPYRAFSGCSGLTSVTIPNSVTSIGYDAFDGCSSLKELTISSGTTTLAFSSSDASETFSGCPIETLTLGRDFTYEGSSPFRYKTTIKSVLLGGNKTSIERSAFYGCSGLTSVTIPNSVTSIGNSAFAECSSLNSMTIGSGVLSIGSDVFSGHKPTKVIWLPNTPPSGYSYASGGQNYVPNDQYKINGVVYPFLSSMFEADGVKYVPVSMSDRTCDAIDCTYDPSIKNVTLGETVEYKGIKMNVNNICYALFYNNKYIKNVTIWRTGNIPKSAFYGCSSLRTATLGDDVTGIGQYAFADCSAMTDIQIGSKVETIDQYAFRNCSKLTKITIPQAVTKIDDYVFSGCTSLKNVYFADRNTVLTLGSNGSSSLFSSCPLDSVYIGGNISYNAGSSYGYSPFYGNTSLRTVVITDKETEISANEFYGCTNLQNFTVGDGLTTFGDRAFSGCSSLKSLLFGSQVQSIGQEAFSDCTSITEITSLAATPPVCGINALKDISKWECTLHVPEGYKAAYLAADQWKDFLFMNGDSGSGETPHVDPNALVISEAGVATYCPTVDVDFTTLTDVKAYIASGFNRETSAVTMTRVYDVPAGTGLLVKGPAGMHEVPQSPSASIYSNMLRGSTIDRNLSATVGSYVNYVLGKIGDEVGFCLVPAEGMTLTAGRAYLTIPGETAASRSALKLRFDDEEEATGVSDVERQENGVSTVYDLQGRRVEQPRSGLYIRGGKKVIIK